MGGLHEKFTLLTFYVKSLHYLHLIIFCFVLILSDFGLLYRGHHDFKCPCW